VLAELVVLTNNYLALAQQHATPCAQTARPAVQGSLSRKNAKELQIPFAPPAPNVKLENTARDAMAKLIRRAIIVLHVKTVNLSLGGAPKLKIRSAGIANHAEMVSSNQAGVHKMACVQTSGRKLATWEQTSEDAVWTPVTRDKVLAKMNGAELKVVMEEDLSNSHGQSKIRSLKSTSNLAISK